LNKRWKIERNKAMETIKNDILGNVLLNTIEATKQTGCKYGSITYTNEHKEKSVYTLLFGFNLTNLYKRDLRLLNRLLSTLNGIPLDACNELISSLNESLSGNGNSKYTLKGYYTNVNDSGEIKLHENNLYIRGYVIKKTVIIPGTYSNKPVKSKEITIEKNKLRKQLRSNKIRMFKLNVNDIQAINVSGLSLTIT
jgi:hypothetical protein